MSITVDQINAAQRAWTAAVVAQDLEGLLSLYADNAVLKPTLSSLIRRDRQGLLHYFMGNPETADVGFLKMGFTKAEITETAPQLQGDVAVDTGHYEFTKPDGDIVKADFTFSYIKGSEGKLLILCQHSSLAVE